MKGGDALAGQDGPSRLRVVAGALLLWALPLYAQDPVTVSGSAGMIAVLSSATEAAATPTMRIGVVAPLDHANTLHVQIDLSGLPGQAVSTGDVESFKSIEMSVAFSHDLAIFVGSPYIEAGFATRLPGDTKPRERAARWACAGVLFDHGPVGYLKLGACGDQRLGDGWQPAVSVVGAVKLWNAEDIDGKETARLSLVVSAVLGLDFTRGGGGRFTGGRGDLVRVGLVAGIGR